MGESNLNVALHTPEGELSDEQKDLLKDSEATLSDSDKALFPSLFSAPTPPAE